MKKLYCLFLCTVALFAAVSCGDKKVEEHNAKIKEQKLTVPQNVKTVSTIAKIEPEDGLIELASESGGIVSKIYKKEGDFIAGGTPLLTLNASTDAAQENVVQNQILTQRKRTEADLSEIRQYEVQLAEKNRDLAVSERLAKTGAETRQNVETKRKERDVIAVNLATARKNAATTANDISVLQAQLKEARANTATKTVRAEVTGVLVNLDVSVGNSVAPLAKVATIAPDGNWVVHGEIDEMFANRVKLGNAVSVKIPGSSETIGTAHITYLSPVLEDKSMFYEVAGEQADRRVRRFKAVLEKNSNLLINQKVECTIAL